MARYAGITSPTFSASTTIQTRSFPIGMSLSLLWTPWGLAALALTKRVPGFQCPHHASANDDRTTVGRGRPNPTTARSRRRAGPSELEAAGRAGSEEEVGQVHRDDLVVAREAERVLLERHLVRDVSPKLALDIEMLGDQVLEVAGQLPQALADPRPRPLEVVEELPPARGREAVGE